MVGTELDRTKIWRLFYRLYFDSFTCVSHCCQEETQVEKTVQVEKQLWCKVMFQETLSAEIITNWRKKCIWMIQILSCNTLKKLTINSLRQGITPTNICIPHGLQSRKDTWIEIDKDIDGSILWCPQGRLHQAHCCLLLKINLIMSSNLLRVTIREMQHLSEY